MDRTMKYFSLLLIFCLFSCSSEPEKEEEKLDVHKKNTELAKTAEDWKINKMLMDNEEARNNSMGMTTTRPLFQSNPKAIVKIRQEAVRGDRDYQYSFAMCYKYGMGVKQDYNKALYWFKKAGDQGHLQARQVYHYMLKRKGR
jgi:TPR repeat protein